MFTTTILKNWTGKSNINELSEIEMEELCKEFPFSPIPFYILTLCKREHKVRYENIQHKIHLFSKNFILTSYHLSNPIKLEDENIQVENNRIEQFVLEQLEIYKKGNKNNENTEIVDFEKITIIKDYFDSQGIKILEQDDKLSMQLKSFTQWLKIVNNQKKKEIKITAEQEKNIVELSEKANQILEIETESMATIFINQGKKNQALEIYLKLIKDFPNKSTYFAQKIEQLNIKN